MLLPAQAGESGRVLPHDREAEQSVLGALMLDQNAVAQVRDILEPQDFYEERHGHIFRAAVMLSDRGEPIDIVTLRNELERSGALSRSGGVDYIAELSMVTPTATSVRHYAEIVIEHAIRRRLVSAGGEIAQYGFDDTLSAQEATDRAEQRVFGIATQKRVAEATHIAPILKDTWSQLETLLGRRAFITGVPTNFGELDKISQGLQAGELIILAARPSVGKTSFALNVARNASVLAGQPVVIFSLEMSKDALVQRLLCSEAAVDSFLLKTGQADSTVFQRIARAMDKLTQADLWIDDTPGLTINALRARARRMKAQHDIKLVVVDYLQLMHGGRTESRVQEVSDISAGLKSIAKELELPVVALSQLSRESERRTDRRPQLSDLRDSGCLAGDTLVLLPGRGRRVPIRELVGSGAQSVLALDPSTWRLERRAMVSAFSTGRKPVFTLRTSLGRSIRATANHRFLTIEGWRRLDELGPGCHIAVPRHLPCGDDGASMRAAELALLGHLIGDGCTLPRHAIQYTTADRELADLVANLAIELFGTGITPRVVPEHRWYQVYLSSTQRLTHGAHNPVAAWLRTLGVFGLRSHEKRVPDAVFAQPAAQIALFLRHLWSTDGCIRLERTGNPSVYYASSSRRLARDVQSLLLRLGINGILRAAEQRRADGTVKGRPQHCVWLSGADVDLFLELVGSLRPVARRHHDALRDRHRGIPNTNRDIIPRAAWRLFVVPSMVAHGITSRVMQSHIGQPYCGTGLYTQNVGRERAARVALASRSEALRLLAVSDVYWDQVVSVEAGGEEEVYDLTVDGLHNFVADDIIVHNSIEQDADIVLFLYREGMHNQEVDKSLTKLIVAKNRNGPIGDIDLVFVPEQTAFREPYRGRHEG